MNKSSNENTQKESQTKVKKNERGITIEDAQELESFKDWNKEQLEELISTLKCFCNISYQIWNKEQEKCNPIRAA
jgi:hypothetical protein